MESAQSWQLDRQALEDILQGACFLGSGGGGPLSGGSMLIDVILKQADSVAVADPAEVPADAMLASVAGLGSPDAASHSADPFSHGPLHAFDLLEQSIGSTFSYVIPAEVGAMNSMVPILVAAQKGLAVIDGDGAGRAIPELPMSCFNAEAPIDPFVIANETATATHDIRTVVHTALPSDVDQIARGIVGSPSFGEEGAFASWAMGGDTMRRVAVARTLSLAQTIGAAIRLAKAGGSDPVAAVLNELGSRAFVLYQGALLASDEQSSGGFDVGRVSLQGQDGSQAWIYNLNENMIAWRTDWAVPLAMGPDSICYITADGQPLSNADITADMAGTEIVLIGIRADDKMRSPAIVGSFEEVFRSIATPDPIPLSSNCRVNRAVVHGMCYKL